MTTEQRLAALEAIVVKFDERNTESARLRIDEEARTWAALSLVQELAERAGVPRERLREHIQARERWWKQRLLQGVSDVDRGYAALLDVRSPDQVPEDDEYPPLFPVPEE